jgi:hypothetical protein
MVDEGGTVGRVLGTFDATPLQFWVAVQPGAYLQLDDVVVTSRELPLPEPYAATTRCPSVGIAAVPRTRGGGLHPQLTKRTPRIVKRTAGDVGYTSPTSRSCRPGPASPHRHHDHGPASASRPDSFI